eukprot:4826646-Amphidinium_carterae.1
MHSPIKRRAERLLKISICRCCVLRIVEAETPCARVRTRARGHASTHTHAYAQTPSEIVTLRS